METNDWNTSETVAVIDLGSNSIKLLVARLGDGRSSLETVFSHTIETRISDGISRENPMISDASFAAGLETVTNLAQMAANFTPRRTRLVATSAVRDARNGPLFMSAIHERTGLNCEILSGPAEAKSIALGIACDPACIGFEDFNHMDLGGGSFEFISFEQKEPLTAISLQLGAVRMMEQFVSNPEKPISPEVRAAIQRHAREQLELSHFKFGPKERPLIATGGAFAVARAILAGMRGQSFEESDSLLRTDDLNDLADRLATQPLSKRIENPFVPQKRADILPVALDTIVAALNYAGKDSCKHSIFNLRYGIAVELLKESSIAAQRAIGTA